MTFELGVSYDGADDAFPELRHRFVVARKLLPA
jgi:hypothetical protein